MSAICGKDRIKAAYKREYSDRVPGYPILGCFNAKLVGITIKQFLTQPEKFAEAQIRGYEEFKPDIVVMLADLCMEAESIGVPLKFPDDSLCYVERPLLREKHTLASLQIPEPYAQGRLPYYLEACKIVAQLIKDSAVGGVISGPWTIAVHLRGIENLIRDTFKDPPFVHELMALTSEVTKRFGMAVVETGVGVSLSEAPASCSLISPNIFSNFIKPYLQQITSFFAERKIRITLHICGYIDPLIEELTQIGISALSFDAPSSLRRMVEIAKNKMVLIGNLSTSLFLHGDEPSIREAVMESVKIAGEGSGYIVSSGCEISPLAPIENIHHFMNALPAQIAEFTEV